MILCRKLYLRSMAARTGDRETCRGSLGEHGTWEWHCQAYHAYANHMYVCTAGDEAHSVSFAVGFSHGHEEVTSNNSTCLVSNKSCKGGTRQGEPGRAGVYLKTGYWVPRWERAWEAI